MIKKDKIIEETKPIPTKTVLTKSTSTNFYVSLTFLSIPIALLIAVSIYPIKNRSKQKYLLPYHITNDELKENYIDGII